jgi:peroxiredoxin
MYTDELLTRRRAARRAFLKRCRGATLAPPGVYSAAARANDLRVGRSAPPATLSTLQGARISSTQLTGHVVILKFWASWCVPCRQELPLLPDYAVRHRDAGLRILGFCLDDPDKSRPGAECCCGSQFPGGAARKFQRAGLRSHLAVASQFHHRPGGTARGGWLETQAAQLDAGTPGRGCHDSAAGLNPRRRGPAPAAACDEQ